MGSAIRTWVADYLDALPAELRLSEADSRYTDPALRAMANGWTPDALAKAVSSTMAMRPTANNPGVYSLRILSDLADGAPIDLRPVADPEGEEWRARLPWTCSHKDARRLGLAPNQCKPCRRIAGDPALLAAGQPGRGVCPVCWLPECDRHLSPPTLAEHIPARRQLLEELGAIPTADMTEDDREAAMLTLIGYQNGVRP